MAYQVFALRWRPQRFADVIGQEHVTRPLQNAIREGRVPHAFLLTGARGVGKTTTARILAKALICEKGPAPEPCNQCRFCREVTGGSAIDVVEMDAASNTGIDDVRELRESLVYAPAAARLKIYIVDEVHMLSKAAFNAFLKTLEEPPPHVKFIFATTDLHKVPVTIQSRCQRYDFRLLDRGEIVEQLRRIVEAEGIAISPVALGTVAAAGEGSLRDAESLLEQVVAYCGRTVADDEVARALGLPEEDTLLQFCSDLLARRGAACLGVLDRVAALGMDARVFAREVLGMLRHLAVLRAAPEAGDLIPTTAETLAELQRLAATASPGHLQSLFEIFLRVETEVRQTTFPRMLLELAVLRAVGLEELERIETVLARLEDLERRLAGAGPPSASGGEGAPGASGTGIVPERPTGPVRVASAEPAPWEAYTPGPARAPAPSSPPETAGPGAGGDLAGNDPETPPPAGAEQIFARIVERVRAAKGMLADFLEHGRVVQAGSGVVEIAFAPEDAFFLDTARETENLACLRAAARETLGGRAEVRLTTLGEDGGAPKGHKAPRESDRERRLRHEALDSDALRWAMEILEARVVDVKLDT